MEMPSGTRSPERTAYSRARAAHRSLNARPAVRQRRHRCVGGQRFHRRDPSAPRLPFLERFKRIDERGLLVDALANSGATIVPMTGFLTGTLPDDDGIEQFLATAERSLEVAKRLDCPSLNVHGTGIDAGGQLAAERMLRGAGATGREAPPRCDDGTTASREGRSERTAGPRWPRGQPAL